MPWKQGQSGNPKGRPRKSQKSMAQLRSQISEHLPDVIEVLANAAKEGDVQAARILVERCVPSMRALDQNINVNDSVRGISDEELLGLMNEFELGTETN
jgi:hypothetical protein|tara:strand:+ start:324 stop:620 length:297 start_codon:yes stop_codon:yes gene_type:complete